MRQPVVSVKGRLLIGALFLVLIVSLVSTARADSPPHVQINTPVDGSTVSGTVEIAGNAWDDFRVGGVKVHIDAGGWWTATDTSENGTWWSWSTSWDTTTVPNGEHRIEAIAWDNASQHTYTSVGVIVHNEPPNTAPWVTIMTPPNHSTVRGVVTVGGHSGDSDADDTVELVQIKIDAGEWRNATPRGENGSWAIWLYNWNTTTYDDGWHAFAARAFDGDAYSEVVVFEYLVDNVPNENHAPLVRVVDPGNHATVWGVVLVHGTAADPDGGDRVELVQVSIDPTSNHTEWHDAVDTSHNGSWGTWAYQWDTTKVANGEHSVCARAWDGDLYSELSCVSVKVVNENMRPKVAIVHPKNGETVRGLVLIHGTASDDHGVRLVDVRFNDGSWYHATDTSPDGSWATWAFEWNTKGRDDGCLHVSARSWDGWLFSEPSKIYVCVDNVNDPPWVKIAHPVNGETVHGLYLVSGFAGDDHGVKLVQVRIDHGEWHNAVNTGREHAWSTWAWEWNTNSVPNGEHHVCARAWDGEKYSSVPCVVVIVNNDGGGGGGKEPAPMTDLGGATPFVSSSLLAGVGVAILMFLRTYGYIRK